MQTTTRAQKLGGRDRKNITRAVRAFLAGDGDAATRALLEFGTTPPDFDLEAFKADIAHVLHSRGVGLIARVSGTQRGPEQRSDQLERLVNELFRVSHRHDVYLPPSTTLLIKTLVTIEGVARSLDPNFNLVTTAIPILLKSMVPSWLRWRSWGGRSAPDVSGESTQDR